MAKPSTFSGKISAYATYHKMERNWFGVVAQLQYSSAKRGWARKSVLSVCIGNWFGCIHACISARTCMCTSRLVLYEQTWLALCTHNVSLCVCVRFIIWLYECVYEYAFSYFCASTTILHNMNCALWRKSVYLFGLSIPNIFTSFKYKRDPPCIRRILNARRSQVRPAIRRFCIII